MKMTVFWVVAPCSLVEVYRRFRGAFCLHYQGDRLDDDVTPSLHKPITNEVTKELKYS
jgi:hypothetical protein